MENINALIVDDEEYSRSSLYFLLQHHCLAVKVINISKSVQEARNFISSNPLDLVFLDIAMPKENGFDLIPLLQEKKIMVIFTTAYNQYALKAIKASAVDYLLKPIDINELCNAVEKAQNLLHTKTLNKQYNNYSKTLDTLRENILHQDKDIKKLTIASSSGFKIIELRDLIYLEASSNYCIFHLINETKVVASKPLKDYEELLTSHNFIRVHKSYIINSSFLVEYKNTNGLQVTLVNDIVIQVSRRRISDFLDKIKSIKIKL